MEALATIAPACLVDGMRTDSDATAARSGSGDSMGVVGSSSTRKRSCSSITSGRSTKRLRGVVHVGSFRDVAAETNVMSEEEGANLKLEVNMTAPSRYVSAASSRPRER